MKAKTFDRKFDAGTCDVVGDLELSTLRHPGQVPRRVSVSLPNWMIALLDREAARLGVSRQSVIREWLAERLEAEARLLTPHSTPTPNPQNADHAPNADPPAPPAPAPPSPHA